MATLNAQINTREQAEAPIRKAPEDWSLEDAKAAVEYLKETRVSKEGFEANHAIAQDGDHFLDFDGWIGPNGGDDTTLADEIREDVERQFSPVDATAEALYNVANALLQSRPTIGFESLEDPPVDETPEARVAREKRQREETGGVLRALATWIARRRLWRLCDRAVKRSQWATWGTVRAWIPESELRDPAPEETKEKAEAEPATDEERLERETVELPGGLDLPTALEKIRLVAPDPSQGFVYLHPDTQRPIGVYLYRIGSEEIAEIVWVDPKSGETVFRTLKGTAFVETSLPLGGFLPIAQMEADLLVTEAVRMGQARLNFAESMNVRVAEQGGFPERYTLNAEPEGRWTTDVPEDPADILATKTASDPAGTTLYLVATERTLGASVTSELVGIYDDGVDGQAGQRATPGVEKFDPTPPEGGIALANHFRLTILRACHQEHVAMSGDATASAVSRIAARAQHIAHVETIKPELEGMLRDLLEAVLRLAALMSEDVAEFVARYRVTVAVKVNAGPLSPEEVTVVLSMFEAGVISHETTLTLLQVGDVQAEIERLRKEPRAQASEMKALGEAAKVWKDAGASLRLAAELVGLPKDKIALIEKDEEEQMKKMIALTAPREGDPKKDGEGTGTPPGPRNPRDPAQAE